MTPFQSRDVPDGPVDDDALAPFGEPVAPAFLPAALRRLAEGLRRWTRTVPASDGETRLRAAEPADVAAIAAAQSLAMRHGCADHYEPETIETLIASGSLLDPALVAAGRYRVCQSGGRVVAGAGWDARAPGACAPEESGTAWMRGVFVHPEAGGRGHGRRVVRAVEEAVLEAGRPRLRLLATLNAVPFYRALGYRLAGARTLALPGAPADAPPFVGALLETELASVPSVAATRRR